MVKHRFDLVVGRRGRSDPLRIDSLGCASEKLSPSLAPSRLTSVVHRFGGNLNDRFEAQQLGQFADKRRVQIALRTAESVV
jgi:hypothetical protein